MRAFDLTTANQQVNLGMPATQISTKIPGPHVDWESDGPFELQQRNLVSANRISPAAQHEIKKASKSWSQMSKLDVC